VHRLRRNRGHTYVHIKDARNYDFNGTRITQALFRVEVGAAGVATVVGHGSDARASRRGQCARCSRDLPLLNVSSSRPTT
jgi:hypothetical protein